MVKKKAVRKSKKFIPQASIVSDEIYIPNHSGMLDAGQVHRTPTDELDPVNKKYVDSNVINAGITFFGYNDASDIGGYLVLQLNPSAQAKETIGPISVLGGATGQLLGSWATYLQIDCEDIINTLTSGIYAFHGHFKAATANRLNFYMEMYVRDSGGTETLIATTEDSDLITTTESEYEFHAVVTSSTTLAAGDRIVVKGYAKNSSAAATDIYIYVEGDTASRVTIRGLTTPSPWSISGTTVYYNNGGVGIGTDTVASGAKLQITKTGAAIINLQDDVASIGAEATISRISTLGGNDSNTREVGGINVSADAAFASGSSPTRMTFRTTASGSTSSREVMRIDPTGDVGIGTTSPGSKLEVNGQVSITGASRIRATRSTAQSIPHNTITKVLWNAENYDNLGEYDNVTNYIFTATESGYYTIKASVLFANVQWLANEYGYLSIYKNGALYSILRRHAQSTSLTTYVQLHGLDMIFLDAGDYIDIRCFQNTGIAVNLHPASAYNYFSVHRLS